VINRHEVKEKNCAYERRLIIADGLVGTKYGLDDRLVVWHPSPAKVEEKTEKADLNKTAMVKIDKKAAKCRSKKVRFQVSFGQAMAHILQTAWWFVEPIFDPESALRNRWERNMINWQDISVFITAGIFGLCLGLMITVCGRIVGICLRILWLVMGI